MESNAVPLRRPGGEVYAVLSVCRDITEIKRKADEIMMMKEFLEKNQKGLKQAQKIARMGSWESNFEMTDLRWSDEVYEIFGVKMEETKPTVATFLSFMHPADVGEVSDLIMQANIDHSDYSFNCRIVRRDGTERYIYADCRFEFEEEGKDPVWMYGIVQDITEQKDIEIKLQKSKARLIEAQGIAHVGSWEMNFEANTSFWSDEAYRIYGLEPGDHQLTYNDWITFIHPEDLEKVLENVRLSHETLTGLSIEHRILTRDGVTKYVNSEARYEFDEHGKPIGLIGVVHDITESKTTEIKLQNLLELTNDQNKRLQNFTYIVSHNIRSHSANISGLVDLLEEQIDNAEFSMLKSSAEKLAETIQNLNGIIAIQTELDKEKSVMCLRDEIGKSLNSINSLVCQSGAQIDIAVPGNVVVEVVPSYLESILLNLLTNAIKYRSPHKKLEISLNTEITEQYVVLSVRDNGIGINLEKYGSSIFGMYKTFHNNTDAKGLGLFIVKNQIEAMNGRIEVESQPDNGCTYKVYFCRNGQYFEPEPKYLFLHPQRVEQGQEVPAKVG
jgi:PAS domain S-box-containing protein